MKNRPKIVVLAPAITKFDVGEAYLGYRLLESLCSRFDITLLTYRLRKRKENALDLPCEEIVSWDELPIFPSFERFNSMLKPWYLHYFFKARGWLKNRIKEDPSIQLIYQLTPMSIRYPSPAIGLDVPFVIGPIGGSVPDLPSFKSEVLSTQGQWYMRLRELDAWRVRHDPWLKQTFSEARKILVTSPHLFGIFDDAQHKKMAVFVEHGLDTVHVRSADLQNESKLRLLYVGRVVRTKGLRDAVRALALLPESLDYSFDVIGDGPDLPAVKAEAKELGVEGKINFVGRLPRSEIDAYYARANLFVFPSFREAAGGVIIEAMSHGVPQLCANYGGPAGIVTKETGVLVDPTNPSKFASDLAEKITRLAIDRMRLSRLAEGAATEAARTYLWERRGEILATYIDMFIGAEPKLDVHKSARLE